MKKINLSIVLGLLVFIYSARVVAGNKDRAGEAGASQLLINPWTKSVGLAGSNTASVLGLEAMSLNIAGLAFTPKTEIMFTHKSWLVGSDVDVNSFGFSQKVGEVGVLGVGIMSMNFGDIDITKVDLPEGGIGTFSPRYLNIDVGYAKAFSNTIYGGISVKIISESISNISSRGMAFDAGVRYVTGENQQFKFGISLKNVGPALKQEGDGLAFREVNENTGVEGTRNYQTAKYELPSLLNMGLSYDFYLAPTVDSSTQEISSLHRLTVSGNFTANSFTKDQYRVGVEYAFKSMFLVRAGYVLEDGTWFSAEKRTTTYTGPAAGLSFVAPLNKKGTTFSLDYAYQFTDNFDGTHSIGVRLNL